MDKFWGELYLPPHSYLKLSWKIFLFCNLICMEFEAKNLYLFTMLLHVLTNTIFVTICLFFCNESLFSVIWTMPGHVKKTTGPDPDPSPWLIVSEELKKKLLSKPYDAKKSCWVPDKATHGYFEGLIETTEGDKVTVKLLETGEVSDLLSSYQ